MSKKGLKYQIKSLAWLIISLYFIMNFFVSAYKIPTGSMERSLRVGDMLLVNKFVYGFRTPDWFGIPFTQIGFDIPWVKLPMFKEPKKGDVVVFKPPHEPELYYVKRCVGTSGDVIEIKDKVLFVNGKPFDDFYKTLENDESNPAESPNSMFVDKYIYPKGGIPRFGPRIYKDFTGNRDNFGPVTVPEGKYFMMGDNRDNSSDSRYWGFVPEDNIVGKPIMVYFSLDPEVPMTNLFQKIVWDRIGFFIR
ncbi:MAG: signal peptidase I [Candidatus Cloacimonadota bacterium]|nr:MAG: signal peptidase I [Candidatus Cloacimonadota bacterium]PIE77595.1 MAG: signal peptidase I [Candidatus Delongbacteria bacterium]